MGPKKGRRRSKESEETGTMKEREQGELMVLNRGSVDLNGREDKKREKKRKVDSGDLMDDGARKGHDDKRGHRKTEEVEKKEVKEKNRRKKRKIDVDEQQHEGGDADIGSSGSVVDHRKVEKEGKGKKEKKDQKKKIQNVEDPRSEKCCANFIGVELDDGKVGEDIKKEKTKKKRIVENHQHERGNADFSCYRVQQDGMVLSEVVEEEKGKEEKKKRKKSKTKGERQSGEKQHEEQTYGPRKKGLENNVHVLRSGDCTTVVKCGNKGGDKGKEKVVGGNFDFSKDIEGVSEPVEILENTRHKKGKCEGEKNGGNDMESEEHGDGQSKYNGKERSESEHSVNLALTEVGEKGKLVKKEEKKKKKKTDATTSCLEGNSPDRKNDNILITKTIEGTPGKAASKKVTFAENVEVFPSWDGKQALVVGKRYSKEEDELLKQAVHNYIECHGLGENGIEMVLQCKKYKQRGCWKEINKSIPWRNHSSIYQRVHTLFERARGKVDWSPEQQELIMQHYKKHGSKWKELSVVLGTYRYDIKDIFRILNHGELRRGRWTPEELDTLYELVNKDLRMSVNLGKKKHQSIFRDNIGWTAISEQLATRRILDCCNKWYQISSPMVSRGIWNNSDDYRLIDALVKLDACSLMEVDWDFLLEHRPGDVCLMRWKELIRRVDRYYSKTFIELVEILAKRYSYDVLEATEATANNTNDEAS